MRREPIVAIATAPTKGAVGIVRVSGSLESIAAVFRSLTEGVAKPAEVGRSDVLPRPREATLLPFFSDDGNAIDRGLVLYFPAPHSYTGEHVLEFHAHGGPVVLQLVLAHCLAAGGIHGVRMAQPGEFTERAFLNGKLDLAQAEAVADLIEASTAQAAKSASRSLNGAFSEQVQTLLSDLIALRMLIEATLDFPEEEIEHLSRGKAEQQLTGLMDRTEALGQKAKQGSLLRDGIRLVIAGQPNVGKSSLLNALSGAEVAIVTPIAGTTRDRIEHPISLSGVPVHLVDTAGLRATDDAVERIGIERTWGAVRTADVVLHLRDLSRGQDVEYLAADRALASEWPAGVPVIEVWNKADLAPPRPESLNLSATSQEGLPAVRDAILAAVGHRSVEHEGVFMARARHVKALAEAVRHLHATSMHLAAGESLDVAAEELRLAQLHLSEITGAFSPDDLLGHIFSRFCIGK